MTEFRTPILPRIVRIKLEEYQPLFHGAIDAPIENNRLLILGGNGLGKTTILQSIIYCLAGEADIDIELTKGKRWGRDYFDGRLDNLDKASVQVECFFGNDKVTIKRGFKTHRILQFGLNGFVSENSVNAQSQFEHYLCDQAGYQSVKDFRFIVHKLCYLPEDRANLAWDSESQSRILMLLFGDLINNKEYIEKRSQLKKLDSEKRHKNVDLNDLKSEYQKQQFLRSPEEPPTQEITLAQAPNIETNTTKDEEVAILRQLSALVKEKLQVQNTIRGIKASLNTVTLEVEEFQNRLSEKEEAFILEQLNLHESSEAKLALYKLLHLHICPACGEKAEELAKKAQQFEQSGACPLCGFHRNAFDSSSSPLLDAQLSEKVREKLKVEKNLLEAEKSLAFILDEEMNVQYRYNTIKLKRAKPVEASKNITDQPLDIDADESTLLPLEEYKHRIEIFEKEYLEIERDFEQLRDELNRKYQQFTRVASERVFRLGELYEDYASSFLGIPCHLEKRPSDIEFLSIDLFVPKFDGKIRPKPENCSEAQRFFLDIAFRMAVIDLAKGLSQTTGSFICETPENALDVTYTDNVAMMFKKFIGEGHALIATGNLQVGGLSGPMLVDIPVADRRKSTLNLLDYGRLSKVQSDNITALRGVYFEHVINYQG